MSRKASFAFVFCAAIFLAPLHAHAQEEVEISFEPTFRAEHAGFSLYDGNPVDPYVFPDEVTIRSSELTSVDGEWTVTGLTLWFHDVPEERGVYMLARVGADSFVLDGAPARGDNYDLAHAAFSSSATSTHHFTLSMPFFGDAATPSGRYLFFAAELPETKTVYDETTRVETTSPYTDDDLAAWLADPSSADTFGPAVSTLDIVIEYINDGPPPCTEDCFSNVLFLPGIEASRLYENGERLWEGKDDQVELLYLDDNGASKNQNIYAKGVIDVFTGAPISVAIYDAFLGDLAQKKSGGVIEDYAAVAYDWRLSIPDILASGTEEPNGAIYYNRATSTPYIEQTLRRLADSSRTGKVTIVTHSNGGLLAKALISELGDEADDLIDKVIMVGAPQLGTPKAIGSLLHGYDTGIPFVMSDERARDFAHNAPMAYQLLPDPDYYQNTGVSIGTPLVTFEPGTSTQAFIDAYGNVIGNADELHRFLIGSEGRTVPAYDDTANPSLVRETLLTEAEQLKQSIGASWQAPAGITVHQIAGIGEDTLAGITYWTTRTCTKTVVSFGRPICLSYEDSLTYTPNEVVDGDGTVVAPSALMMSTSTENVKRWWVNLAASNGDNGRFWFFRLNHKNILEVPEVRTFIFKNLIEKSSDVMPSYISANTPQIVSDQRLRFILHSPLALSATDVEGNEISADTATIPGATYKQYGEVQVITVPADSHPTVTLTGTDSGSFTLEAEEYNGNALTNSASFIGVPSGANTIATIAFSDGTVDGAGNLAIDYDGDGSTDVELPTEETVLYSDYISENEEPEEAQEITSPAAQSGGGGGVIVGLIGADNTNIATSTATSTDTESATTTLALGVSVQLEPSVEITDETKSIPPPESAPQIVVVKDTRADVATEPVSVEEEAISAQPQLASAAKAATWYDILTRVIIDFSAKLYRWMKILL